MAPRLCPLWVALLCVVNNACVSSFTSSWTARRRTSSLHSTVEQLDKDDFEDIDWQIFGANDAPDLKSLNVSEAAALPLMSTAALVNIDSRSSFSNMPAGAAHKGGVAGHPENLVGPIQLEEVEHDTTTLTALRLESDGSVTYMETDGPTPTSMHGEWSSDGEDFWMIISRVFDGKFDTAYTIARIYHGEQEGSNEFTTIGGEVRIDDNPVGYFKVLVLSDELLSADDLNPVEVA